MSMLLETALAAAAAASPNLAQCTWDRPGHNPFMGDVVAAVDRYGDIPTDVRAKLKQRMRDRQYDELVLITRNSITGKHRYDTKIRDMHFGTGQVCGKVTRAKWTAKTQERGMVYCEASHCVMVPTVCRNVSRVTRLPERLAGVTPGPGGAGSPGPAGAGQGGTPLSMGSTMSFDPTSAGPLAGGGDPQSRSFAALGAADPAAAVSPTSTALPATTGAGGAGSSAGAGGGAAPANVPASGDSSGGSGGGSGSNAASGSPGYFGGGGPVLLTGPVAAPGGTGEGTDGGTTGPAVPGTGTPTTPTGPDGGLAPSPGGGTDIGPTPAIPEPQTYVLMLAGLLAVSALARRRRRAPGKSR